VLAALPGVAAMTSPAALPATAAASRPHGNNKNYVARRVSDNHRAARTLSAACRWMTRLSSLILDRYLDAIDGGAQFYFLCQRYRPNSKKYRYELGRRHQVGGTSNPAFVIFLRRYQQRSPPSG